MILLPAVCDELEVAPLWWFATCAADRPNLVPIHLKRVWCDRLLIVDLFLGRTRLNLAANDRVAVAVATLYPKVGYRLEGRATVHRHGPAFEAACTLLKAEGLSTGPETAIVVDVDAVFPLDPGSPSGQILRTM